MNIKKLLAILAVALALTIVLMSAAMAGNCMVCHQKSGVDSAVMTTVSTSAWNPVTKDLAKGAVATATDVSQRYYQTAAVVMQKELEVGPYRLIYSKRVVQSCKAIVAVLALHTKSPMAHMKV